MKRQLFLLAAAGTVGMGLGSCDALKQTAGSAASLTQCEYSYNSIAGLSLAGVNVQNITSLSSLNLLDAAKLTAALAQIGSGSGTLPLQFTLNLDVKNPGTQTAAISALQYILEIDDVEMTGGNIEQGFSAPAGGVSQLPVQLSFDLKKVMTGQSADAIKNLAMNFIGVGSTPTNVRLRLKPSMTVAGKTIISPTYIPVTFQYGKGAK
ncbi:MAG: LEA type 2 family protein [Rikenellaceae bacterium]|jgi:LEA14-like dessication related protein|nr:LEA type 2 family protein [Rikenellaceae bacterium]